jgi:hypothetical protein
MTCCGSCDSQEEFLGMGWGREGFKIRQDETFMVAAPSEFAGWKTGYGPGCECGGSCGGSCGGAARRGVAAECGGSCGETCRGNRASASVPGGIGGEGALGSIASPGSALSDTLLRAHPGWDTTTEATLDVVSEAIDVTRLPDLIELPVVPVREWMEWNTYVWGGAITFTTVVMQVVEHEKICGPDVTDFVVKELMRLAASHFQLDKVASVSGFGRISLRSQVKGNPNKAVAKTGRCPRNCQESIALCERCISDQVPGNVALAVVTGKARAAEIGAAEAKLKGETDSPEDIASYDIGDIVGAEARKHQKHDAFVTRFGASVVTSYKDGGEAAVKEALCKEIAEATKNKKLENLSETQNCEKCPDGPWPG